MSAAANNIAFQTVEQEWDANLVLSFEGKSITLQGLPKDEYWEWSDSWSTQKNENTIEGVGYKTAGDATTFYVAIKRVWTYSYIWDSNPQVQTTWDIYAFTLDSTHSSSSEVTLGTNWSQMVWGQRKISPYESLIGLDLNNDGVIGPKDLAKVNTDTHGEELWRDAEGATYVKNSGGQYVHLRVDETETFSGDENWGGGHSRQIFAVEKGDPFSKLAQKAFDAQLADISNPSAEQLKSAYDAALDFAVDVAKTLYRVQDVTTLKNIVDNFKADNPAKNLSKDYLFSPFKYPISASTDQDRTDADQYWVVIRDQSWSINNAVKTVNGESWSFGTIDPDGSSFSQFGQSNVSWLEDLFGQDIKNPSVAGSFITIIEASGEKSGADFKGLQLGLDSDGVIYLLEPKLQSGLASTINDFRFTQIYNQWGGELNIANSYSYQSGNNTVESGRELVALVSKTENNETSYFLISRYFEKTTNSSAEVISYTYRDYSQHRLSITQDDDLGIYQARADWGTFISKITDAETEFSRDLNGDGVVGAGDPTPVSSVESLIPNSNDLPSTLLLKDKAGTFFIGTSDLIAGGTTAAFNSQSYYLITVSQGGSNPAWEDSWSAQDKFEAYAVVKASAINFPNKAWDWNDEEAYYVAVKKQYSYQSKPTWEIHRVELNGSITSTSTVWVDKITAWEAVFLQDLNGDGQVTTPANPLQPTLRSELDNTGAQVGVDADGAVYIRNDANAGWKKIFQEWGGSYDFEYGWQDGQGGGTTREVLVAERVAGSSDSEPEYWLGIRQTQTYSSSSSQQPKVTWDIYKIKTKTADDNSYSYPGMMLSEGMPAIGDLYLTWSDAKHGVSISGYENLFNQDLNGDGVIGINLSKLTPVESDTNGARLERDAEGGLFVVNYDQNGARVSAKAITNGSWLEYRYEWSGGFNEQKAMAIQEVVENGQITGYKLAIRSTNKWSEEATTSWNIYHLNADAELQYGYWDPIENRYIDLTIYGASSIAAYEKLFNEDLNNDGFIGIDTKSLTNEASDTNGARLARDGEKGLYIVDGDNIKTVGNAAWLEYSYSWGSTRKAVAVEAKADNSGYVLAVKNTHQMWTGSGNKDEVTWDILQLDKDGKLTYGYWDNSTNQWRDDSVYGIKSIAAYEFIFNEDFNGDGFIGIRVEDLEIAGADTTGAKLARDKSGGLYIVHQDNTVKAISNAGWLEYDYGWGQKREAIALEEETANGTITGYRVALKNTSTQWDGTTNVTWDVMYLDSTGKLTYGYWDSASNQWRDESVYGTKSIAPYEHMFNQDLNGDGKIGVDISTLDFVDTDTQGVRLARDTEGGLYFITGSGDAAQAKPVGNAGWLEYDYGWGSSREAVAIEAWSEGGRTGYKLALKNTNNYNSESSVTWDILHLDSDGRVVYGYWDPNENMWVDESIWSSNTIAFYEKEWFGQDLNGDGYIGIDLSTLVAVGTDTGGNARLRRDDSGALYVVNAVTGGVEVAKPIGNASWLEYNYSWSGYENSREAIAIESIQNGLGEITGYKLALKQTNNWNGLRDVSYEVLTLNAKANITYNMGSSLWTKNVRLVEALINEDLDGDGEIGVPLSSLKQIVVTTEGGALKRSITTKPITEQVGFNNINDINGLLLAIDTTDNSLFILEQGKKVPVVDSFGSLPNLTYQINWGRGSSTSEVWAVAKQNVASTGVEQYRLIVKVISTSTTNDATSQVTSWQIHTVDSTGTLDWSRVATVRDPVRFESMFNLDFNGDGSIGRLPDLTPAPNDKGDNVIMIDNVSKSIYIRDKTLPDSSAYTFIVDPNGGSPSFFATSSNSLAEPYAVSKNADGSYWLAVEKTVTRAGSQSKSWDVYYLNARDNDTGEAIIDWSKTVFTTDTKAVEVLLRQDIDNDGEIGHDNSPPIFVEGDVGTVKVGQNTSGFVFIQDDTTLIPVVDASGLGVKLAKSVTFTGGSFKAELMASVKVQEADANVFKIAVRETTSSDAAAPQTSWKIYTVNASSGVIDSQPVTTASIVSWENLFGQDLNGDQVQGINLSNLQPVAGDADLATDTDGAVYVLFNGRYIPVVGSDRGAISFNSFENIGTASVSSQPVAAEKQSNTQDDVFLLAVRTILEDAENEANNVSSWTVHSLKVEGNNGDARATVLWDQSVVTTDMTEFNQLFNTDFSSMQSTVVGA